MALADTIRAADANFLGFTYTDYAMRTGLGRNLVHSERFVLGDLRYGILCSRGGLEGELPKVAQRAI